MTPSLATPLKPECDATVSTKRRLCHERLEKRAATITAARSPSIKRGGKQKTSKKREPLGVPQINLLLLERSLDHPENPAAFFLF